MAAERSSFSLVFERLHSMKKHRGRSVTEANRWETLGKCIEARHRNGDNQYGECVIPKSTICYAIVDIPNTSTRS